VPTCIKHPIQLTRIARICGEFVLIRAIRVFAKLDFSQQLLKFKDSGAARNDLDRQAIEV
jgi:hypothetical protein